jgi:hypothetical protein
MQGRKKTIGLLIILVVIAVAPLLAARYVFNHTKELHIKKRNHGEFVHATRVADLQVTQTPASSDLIGGSTHAKSINLSTYAGRWLLVYDTQGQCCQTKCQRGMRGLYQVRIAEHNGIERSVVGLLQPEHCPRPSLAKSNKLWQLTDKQLTAWQQKLPGKQPQILIIDPNGWVALKYDADVGPKPVYEDLRILLHTSQIG